MKRDELNRLYYKDRILRVSDWMKGKRGEDSVLSLVLEVRERRFREEKLRNEMPEKRNIEGG